MRLAIACSSLSTSRGGTERAATSLAAEMLARGHKVLLLSTKMEGNSETPLYGVPKGAEHIAHKFDGSHAEIRQLKEILLQKGIDVFLSMQSDAAHLYWSMACMGSGIPFICSERCDPVLYTENRAWNRVGRLAVLSGADFIHELLPAYVESVPVYLRHKIRIIPNAAPRFSTCFPDLGQRSKNIVYLARFDSQKRPLLLLDAFRMLAPDYPDWNLVLWGHGPEEKAIKKYVRGHGLQKRVLLRGECLDVEAAYASGQIYCLPSQYEGFPNTALEAMAAGLPVAGCGDCIAMAQLLANGNGMLAETGTAASLAAALEPLVQDVEARRKFAARGSQILAEYSPAVIFDQWENLFREASESKDRTVMDSFYQEPFASMARLSAVARREWLYRNFGEKMPYRLRWWGEKAINIAVNLAGKMKNRLWAGQ